MRSLTALVLVVFLCVPSLVAAVAAGPGGDCRIIVLKDGADGLALESVPLTAGEVRLFAGDEIVTVIVPFGIGMSGDLLQAADAARSVSVLCDGGELRITSHRPDGSERALPAVPVGDLDAYDMRVNVTTGTGTKQAFMIRGYREIEGDDGPVIDMFGGAIPMAAGDYSVTTEVSEHESSPGVYGEAPLRYVDGLLLIDGRTAGGSTGTFIVDFGAGGTVVAKEFLPEGTEIGEVVAVEHSGEGSRVLPGTMSGAGGEVAGFLGSATLAGLSFGTISVGEAQVSVIDRMPDFGDEPIAGILGLDVLARAEVVSFGYATDGETRLTMSDEPSLVRGEGVTIVLPILTAADHIFIEGSIGGAPVTFLLDTGARGTIVPGSVAAAAGLGTGEKADREFRGLDGNPLPARFITAEELRLGTASFPDSPVYVAELPVLENWGLDETSGLLGNDFLERYDRIELDFSERLLRLRRSEP